MHTEHEPTDPLTDLGYEPRDISVPVITKSVVGFFAFGIGSAILAALFMWIAAPGFWGKGMQAGTKHETPPPPNPILQNNITAKTDIIDVRRKEEQQLNSTAWTDTTKSHVRIPIDQAMDLIVQRGLHATGQEVQPPPAPPRKP